MRQNSTFSLRQNRFNERIKEVEKNFTCIQYKKFFKSIKIEEVMFTNFVGSLASSKYIKLREIYNRFNNNENVLEKTFQADELLYNNYKIKRLFDIIQQNTGIKLEKYDINKIFKFKCNEDDEIQFYFYLDNGVLNLYLVDIYHLAIVAKKCGKYIWEEKYKFKKGCKFDIANLKEQR